MHRHSGGNERKEPFAGEDDPDRQSCGLRLPRASCQFSKCAAGEPAKFGRRGVEFLGVIGAPRLECGEPAAKASELIRRQLGNSFGDFFNFHMAQYSTVETWSGLLLGRTGH